MRVKVTKKDGGLFDLRVETADPRNPKMAKAKDVKLVDVHAKVTQLIKDCDPSLFPPEPA